MKIQDVILKAGGTRKVAEELGLSVQAVYQWKRVPVQHIMRISRMAKLKPEQLLEDVA